MPQASTAVHVLVFVYALAQLPGVVASLKVSDAVPHASDAVGVAKDGVAGQEIDDAAGSAEIVGGVLSITVMTCEAVAVLPQASVAVHVLVTIELLAQVPGAVASENVSEVVPQASDAVGEANAGVAGQEIVVGAGTADNVGAVLSTTEITCDAVAVLPHPSVATKVLVMV